MMWATALSMLRAYRPCGLTALRGSFLGDTVLATVGYVAGGQKTQTVLLLVVPLSHFSLKTIDVEKIFLVC